MEQRGAAGKVLDDRVADDLTLGQPVTTHLASAAEDDEGDDEETIARRQAEQTEKDRLREWMWTVPPPPAHDPGAEPPKELRR